MTDFSTKFIKQNLERASHVDRNDWEEEFYQSVKRKFEAGVKLSQKEKNNLEIIAIRCTKQLDQLVSMDPLEVTEDETAEEPE